MIAGALSVGALALAAPVNDCPTGGGATTQIRERDAVLGPLVLINGEGNATRAPNGFGRKGYKLPATLLNGTVATLQVPASMRGKVGLVFRPRVQDRVWERGVRAADTKLTFKACEGEGRTGWPGGLVVDRPRCAVLVVKVRGAAPVRARLPLGRPCT